MGDEFGLVGLSHGVCAVSRSGTEIESSAVGGDRQHATSSGRVGLPGQVSLPGFDLARILIGRSGKGGWVGLMLGGCVALALGRHGKRLGQGKEKCLVGSAREESWAEVGYG
jgi:hypothetical protein